MSDGASPTPDSPAKGGAGGLENATREQLIVLLKKATIKMKTREAGRRHLRDCQPLPRTPSLLLVCSGWFVFTLIFLSYFFPCIRDKKDDDYLAAATEPLQAAVPRRTERFVTILVSRNSCYYWGRLNFSLILIILQLWRIRMVAILQTRE